MGLCILNSLICFVIYCVIIKNFESMRKITFVKKICFALLLSMFAIGSFATELTEGFESPSPAGVYAGVAVTYSSGNWYVKGSTAIDASDRKIGSNCVRLRGKSSNSDVDHQVAMLFDKSNAGTVSFQYGSYSTHSGGIIRLQKSTDQADASAGTGTWVNVGDSIVVPAWSGSLLTATFPVNYSGNIRFRIVKKTQTTSSSVCVDDFKITDFGVSSAQMPELSVLSGIYTVAQTVSISSKTPLSTIYFTIDGTVPTTASSIYSSPIAISQTTTLNAIAVAEGLSASGVASATYTFPTNISDLATLQSKMPRSGSSSECFKYTGEATVTASFISTSGIQSVYLQDATGGMVICDTGKKLAASYKSGDKITGFVGNILNFNALPELIPIGDFVVNSTGNVLTPATVTFASLESNLLKLVKIVGVSFADANGSAAYALSTNYSIGNSTGSAVFRIPHAFDYVTSIVPSSTDLVCIVSKSDTTYQLFARSKSDISSLSMNIDAALSEPINIFVKSGELVVEGADAEDLVKVYRLDGSLAESFLSKGSDVVILSKGVYVVSVGALVKKVVL
jgi:hypothetical protein